MIIDDTSLLEFFSRPMLMGVMQGFASIEYMHGGEHGFFFCYSGWMTIRDFPDHATFREKGAKLACADKLGVFLSLSICKKANFEYLSFIK